MNGFYGFTIGWGIILALFYGSTKFEGTRTLTYYVLWIAIVLTMVVHSKELTTLIQNAVPAPPPQETGSASA